MSDRLAELFVRIARGELPVEDRGLEVLSSPDGPADGLVAFPGHTVLAAAVPADEARARFDPQRPFHPAFLRWIAETAGREPQTVDVLSYAVGTGTGSADLTRADDLAGHPVVAHAARYRREVEVYTDRSGLAICVLGRGLAGRREVFIEVPPSQRDAGLGRKVLQAVIDLTPAGEGLWAQISAFNAPSLRAFFAAGFRPVGGEILFL